jgi:hypothetical protein
MKKRQIFLIPVLFIILSIMLSPSLATADYLIKGRKHTDAFSMMGQSQPAKDEDITTWLSKQKMRRDEGDTTTLIRFDQNKLYMISHSDKTYSEMDLPIDLEKAIPPQAQQMLQSMQMTSKVTNTGKTQTINNWKCNQYLVEIAVTMMGMSMPIKMDIWTTEDLGVDTEMYKRFYAETLSLNPMMKDFAEEFNKMEGYPVLTRFTMDIMGNEQKSEEEVLSAEKKDAPAGTYDLPQGYSKAAYNPFQQQK